MVEAIDYGSKISQHSKASDLHGRKTRQDYIRGDNFFLPLEVDLGL